MGAIINAEFIRSWSAVHNYPLHKNIPLYTDAGVSLRDKELASDDNKLDVAASQLVINNEQLAESLNPYALKREITEYSDFFIVPVPVFDFFESKYGTTRRFVRCMVRTGLLRTARAAPQLYPSFVRVVPCIQDGPHRGEALRTEGETTLIVSRGNNITAAPIVFACPESTTVQRVASFALHEWRNQLQPDQLIVRSLTEFESVNASKYDQFIETADSSAIRCYVRQALTTATRTERTAALARLQSVQSGQLEPYYPADWPFAPPGAKIADPIQIDTNKPGEELEKQEKEVLEAYARVPVPVDVSAGDEFEWTLIAAMSQMVNTWPIPSDSAVQEIMVEVRGDVAESATAAEVAMAWPRGRFIPPEPPRFIYPGKLVDALDKQYKWYKAKVLHKNENGTWRVTYLEWSAANDEDVAEDLIEPWDTCTKGLKNRIGISMEMVGKPVRLLGQRKGLTSTHNPYAVSTYGSYYSGYYGRNEPSGTPGKAGLENLGNTCFMNSILQCISAMPLLTDLFLDKARAQALVNRNSKLGKQGRLAEQLTKWLEDMWGGKLGVVNPSGLRAVIVKGTPFDGFEQHDSSEFLTYLLDNIHEELNQCTEKPQTQEVEGKGRDDFLVAKEAWDVHLLRNRSWVCDRFGGQIKSTLVCQQCKNVSVKFDYMQFLTVGLPVDKNLTRTVNVVRTSPKFTLTTVTIRLGPNDTVGTILDTLADNETLFSPKLERRRLVLREPGPSSVTTPWKGTIAQEKKMADELATENLYVYEIQPNIFGDPAEDLRSCYYFPLRLSFPETGHVQGETVEDVPILLALPAGIAKKFAAAPASTAYGTTASAFSGPMYPVVPGPDDPDSLCAPEAPPRPPTPIEVHFTSGVEGPKNADTATKNGDEPEMANSLVAATAAAQVAGTAHAPIVEEPEDELRNWQGADFEDNPRPAATRDDSDDDNLTSSVAHIKKASSDVPNDSTTGTTKRVGIMATAGVGNLGTGDPLRALNDEFRKRTANNTSSFSSYSSYGSSYGMGYGTGSYGYGSTYGYGSAYNRPVQPTIKLPANKVFEAIVELLLSGLLNPGLYPSLKTVFKARNAEPVFESSPSSPVTSTRASPSAQAEAPAKGAGSSTVDDDEDEEKKVEEENKVMSHPAPSLLHAWGIDLENVEIEANHYDDWSLDRSKQPVNATSTNPVDMVTYGSVGASIRVDLKVLFNAFNAPTTVSSAPDESVANEPTIELAGGAAVPLSKAGGLGGTVAPSLNDTAAISKSLIYTIVKEPIRSPTAPELTDDGETPVNYDPDDIPPKPTTYFSRTGSQSRRSAYYNPYSVKGSSRLNLLDSLKEYSQTELLKDDNAVYCRICKQHTPTTKRLEIFRLPDVLIIVLKRFSTRDFINYHKNDTPVDYPLLGLDMSDYVAEQVKREYIAVCREANAAAVARTGDPDVYYNQPKVFEQEFHNIMSKRPSLNGFPLQNDYTYDLTGVSLHSGTRTGGHYTARTRNFLTGEWMFCDDRSVTTTPLDAAQDDQAYVLCYQRRRCTRDIEPAVTGLAPFQFPEGVHRFRNGKDMKDVL